MGRTTTLARGVPPEFLKRRALEEHVERMIALLDEIDGDPDLEPDNDAEQVNEDGSDLGDFGDNGIADLDGAAEQMGDLWTLAGRAE